MPDQIRIIFTGSKAGYDQLMSIFRCGQLSDICGFLVSDITWEAESMGDVIKSYAENAEEVGRIETELSRLDHKEKP